jgi:Rap1a immunity proteins
MMRLTGWTISERFIWRLRRCALALLALLAANVLSHQARCQEIDVTSGNYWTKLCRDSDLTACSSCILALRETSSFDRYVRNSPIYCLPVGATVDQMRRVILKFADDNPGMLHLPFVLISIRALKQSFPCQ